MTATSAATRDFTWTFSESRTVGQYANGDWWVLGPVTITAITPESANDGGWIKHGTMLNPPCGTGAATVQGYDSSAGGGSLGATWDAASNVAPSMSGPLIVTEGSVVSAKSRPTASAGKPQIQDMAILTVVSVEPAAGDFRPDPHGTDKSSPGNLADVDTSFLRSLTPPANSPSSAAAVAELIDGTMYEGLSGEAGRFFHPLDHQEEYGRDHAKRMGTVLLALHLNYTTEEKSPMVINMIQHGIDIHGRLLTGQIYGDLGGLNLGRKGPLLFAGMALNHAGMLEWSDAAQHNVFQEDLQCFYISQADVDRGHAAHSPGKFPSAANDWTTEPHNAATDNDNRRRSAYTSAMIGLPEWGEQHKRDPKRDGSNWDVKYRDICNCSFLPHALFALLAGAKGIWNRPEFFDYVERVFSVSGGSPSNSTNGILLFHASMWTAYRALAPLPVVRPPAISPPSKVFASDFTVTITPSVTPGSTTRFTTDGSDPVSGSTAYTVPFSITATATVKVRAFKSGMTDSDVVEAVYTKSPADVPLPPVGPVLTAAGIS